MTHTSSAFWTCFMSGMKRKETPSVFLSTSGVTAKSYTLSMDTFSTRDCFASFGFCSLTCMFGMLRLSCTHLTGIAKVSGVWPQKMTSSCEGHVISLVWLEDMQYDLI